MLSNSNSNIEIDVNQNEQSGNVIQLATTNVTPVIKNEDEIFSNKALVKQINKYKIRKQKIDEAKQIYKIYLNKMRIQSPRDLK